MSNDLTSRLVADHALLIEKRLQDWQDGFRAGQEAMREAAIVAVRKHRGVGSAEMRKLCASYDREARQDAISEDQGMRIAAHNIEREIRSLPIKDAPDD